MPRERPAPKKEFHSLREFAAHYFPNDEVKLTIKRRTPARTVPHQPRTNCHCIQCAKS